MHCARRMATMEKGSTLCKYIFALAIVPTFFDLFDIYIISCKISLCIAFSIKTILSFIYSALLQMVKMTLREQTLDCICKMRHAKKFASVLEDIRSANYMLYWVVSIFCIY